MKTQPIKTVLRHNSLYKDYDRKKIEGESVIIPCLLVKHSEEYMRLINCVPDFIEDYTDTGIAIGDTVLVRKDRKFSYGLADDMAVLCGTKQKLIEVEISGRISFEPKPEFRRHSPYGYAYGWDDIS